MQSTIYLESFVKYYDSKEVEVVKLIEMFKKQGGMKLIKQYYNSGTLLTAVLQLFLLGNDRTALEILRLTTQLKIKQKLQKKYIKSIDYFENNWDDSLEHISSNKVWICWFQGIENAPMIVQRCYQSVREHMPNKDVILITANNMFEYVKFPQFIIDKWKKGIITNTHMTDLLRLELLIKYGGMWLDATVYCSGGDIPDYYFESDLFLYQCLKPGRDGHANYISSWLISAKTNNKVLMATRMLCYEYWKKHNCMYDYFLLHDFLTIALDRFECERKKILPKDNATPHILLLSLFEQYNDDRWKAIKEQSSFHKLSYKMAPENEKLTDTYYDKIFKKQSTL